MGRSIATTSYFVLLLAGGSSLPGCSSSHPAGTGGSAASGGLAEAGGSGGGGSSAAGDGGAQTGGSSVGGAGGPISASGAGGGGSSVGGSGSSEAGGQGAIGGATGGSVDVGGSTSGGGGSSSGGGATGGGPSGGDTGSGGDGGQGGPATDPGDFLLGEGSTCPGAFSVCESFESTGVGELPAGWSSEGYGERTLGVTDELSARGQRALRVDVAAGQSAVVAMLQLVLPDLLKQAHFGRMFYRIEGPGVTEFVHFDVMEATGPWQGHQNAVRYASTGTMVGTEPSNWSFIYNVQPFGDGAGAEFGTEGARAAHPRVDDWMCLEWSFDSGAQTAVYFLDGTVIEDLVIDTERAEVPVMDNVRIGFQKFQQTGAFRVWVDELALDPARVGCDR